MQSLINTLKDKTTLKKIGWSLLLLLVFRLGLQIVAPGVDQTAVKNLDLAGAFQLLDLLSGGGLSTLSILSLGVMPYITAQIFTQILQSIEGTRFNEWSKQGELGRNHLKHFSLALSFPLALLQGVNTLLSFNQMTRHGAYILHSNSNFQVMFLNALLISLSMAVASTALAWFAEYVTQHGISNGPSLIIMVGILDRIPQSVKYFQVKTAKGVNSTLDLINFSGTIIIFLLVILLIVFIQKSVYYIKLNRVNNPNENSKRNNLPLLLNGSGVIPVIFGSSIFATVQTLVSALHVQNKLLEQFFSFQAPQGICLYGILIIIFTYFYSTIQENPTEMAEMLQQQNSLIPNIEPGAATEHYIARQIYALDCPGSLYLAALAIIPMLAAILTGTPENLILIGTSLLIVVTVLLEIADRLGNVKIMNNYSGLF